MPIRWINTLSLGRSLLDGFTQLAYPNTCWTCGCIMPTRTAPVCANCLPQLTRDPFPTCPRCSSSVGPNLALADGCPACRDLTFTFDSACRMAPYQGLLRDVILRMKHWTGEDLTEAIGSLWAEQMTPRLQSLRPDVVIPIPLHWTRRWRRGFNQSEILASCLARGLHIPCQARALVRLRRTAHQTHQTTAAARLDNLRRAFRARANVDLAGKSVLLVDDVLTSGATANEATRALRTLHPRAVHVVVLAHGK